MMRGQIVTGLDIGSGSIKAMVVKNIGDEWEVLHYAQVPSFGLRKGSVVKPDEVSKNIQILMSSVEKSCGIKIRSVFVNIGGSHLYIKHSDGLISVSRADHIISQEDIERVLQAAKAVNIPNEEVLDIFPKEFIVDDQKGIKQPLGLTGVRLEAKVILLCYFQSFFINLSQAVLSSGLQIEDIIPSPLAAAEAVLTPQQKELGVALVDIGSSTTSLAVFEEGDLIHFAVIPLGSSNITNDIAIGLKTEVSIAEEIKKRYGSCLMQKDEKSKRVEVGKKIEISDGPNPFSFTKKDLVYIIEPRVREIFELIQKELKHINRQEMLPGGVVLTGGGAKLPKIKELARQQLKLTCQIGLLKGIKGIESDPALATVAGLVMGAGTSENSISYSLLSLSGFFKGMFSGIKKVFRAFVP